MALSRKEEARALDVEEAALVAKSHHPALQSVADAELASILRQLRERPDRAQRRAAQQRRERRGKGSPRGAEPAADDTGSHRKAEVLATAVRRLNNERARRSRGNG